MDGALCGDKLTLTAEHKIQHQLSRKDLYALHKAQKSGYMFFFFGHMEPDNLVAFLQAHGFEEVNAGGENELLKLEQTMIRHRLKQENVLGIGSDITNIQWLLHCGIRCCPADASAALAASCDYQSDCPGGGGAVYDVVMQVMRLHHEW